MRLVSLRNGVLPSSMRMKDYRVVIRDISATGVQILTDTPMPEQAVVEISFSIGNEAFAEQAEVAWAKVVDTFFLFGIRFIDPDLFLQQVLNDRRSRP